MNRLTTIVGALLIGLLAGCSTDQLQIIDQPTQVGPGDTVTISLMNLFVHTSTSGEYDAPITRDSLYFAVGLPSDWQPLEAKYYVADQISLASAPTDTNAMDQAMNDSLAAFLERMAPMPSSAALSTFMTGQDLSYAPTPMDSAVTISADSIDKWQGYAVGIDVSITKPDTVISMQDAGAVVDSTMDPSMLQMVDSIATAMVPILVQIKCLAGTAVGSKTIYFYGKTGGLPDAVTAPTQEQMIAYFTAQQYGMGLPMDDPFDIGTVGTAVVTVGNTGVNRHVVATSSVPGLVTIRQEAGRVIQISYSKTTAHTPEMAVFSLKGELIRHLQPRPAATGYDATWNGMNDHGAPVPQGSYLLRVTDATSVHTQPISLLRR